MKAIYLLLTVIFTVVFSGCSGGGGSSHKTPQITLWKVNGNVSGLKGTLILQNNLSDDLTIQKDGSFTFSKGYPANSDYNITVLTQPLQQLCSVANASGTVISSDITNIVVDCIHVNQAPVAVNDTAETNRSIPIVIDILNNDSDSDGTLKISSLSIISPVSNGTTDINTTTGTVTYTPNDMFVGKDMFTYTIKDNNGSLSNVATVNITVNNDRCWVNISNSVLDVNQSLGAERASLVINKSTDKLYASWVEGSWDAGDYIVKEYDPNTNTWTRLNGIINDRNVTGWSRPVTKLAPDNSELHLLGYGDEGTYSRGYFVKNWDSAQWNSVYSSDEFMSTYDLALGNNLKRYIAKINGDDIQVVYKMGEEEAVLFPAIDEGDNKLSRPHIVLQTDTTPIVAYYSTDDYSHSKISKYVPPADLNHLEQGDWVSLGTLDSNTSRQTVCMSVLMDSSNELVIAYVEQYVPNKGGDEQTVNVKRYHNDNWELIGDTINGTTSVSTEGTLESGGSHYNQCISLAEASNGDLFVAWQHKENGRNSIYTQTYNGTSWSDAAKPLIDDSNIKTPSLVVDSQGRMNISVVYDSTPSQTDMDDVKVFRCEH